MCKYFSRIGISISLFSMEILIIRLQFNPVCVKGDQWGRQRTVYCFTVMCNVKWMSAKITNKCYLFFTYLTVLNYIEFYMILSAIPSTNIHILNELMNNKANE